jgi:hypothetical protein
MFQTRIAEEIEKNSLCLLLFFENLGVYWITWKNILEPDRPQMTMWRMNIA